jgi:hypothetical protein
MYHKVNKQHLRTRHILRQKMLPFKFGLGTQLRVLPELGCTKHPRTLNPNLDPFPIFNGQNKYQL